MAGLLETSPVSGLQPCLCLSVSVSVRTAYCPQCANNSSTLRLCEKVKIPPGVRKRLGAKMSVFKQGECHGVLLHSPFTELKKIGSLACVMAFASRLSAEEDRWLRG